MKADDDDAEFWRDVRCAGQQRRAERLAAAVKAGMPAGFRALPRNPYHWQGSVCGDLLDYWPSTGRWRWRERSYHGSHSDLVGFVRRRLVDHD